ncbi:hypothetical protein ACFFLM_19130 [Deinococcus oregonensis]|uniref:Uncharacterized protein n=1 Tax=Deinococcus oregonensis TaxID=1805970 RepID=A0ABV6B2Z1_9DEIO
MELIATTRPEPVAYAYGAALRNGGRALRCGLLFIKRGNTRKTLVLRDPDTKQRIRVRLPKAAVGNKKHLRFSRELLEVV